MSTLRSRRWLLALLVGLWPGGRLAWGQCVDPDFDATTLRPNVEVADLDADGLPEVIIGHGGVEGHGGAAQVFAVNAKRTKLLGSGLAAPPFAFRERDPDDIRHWIDHGARFIDLDRDGYNDLVVSYQPTTSAGSARTAYWHNVHGTGWTGGAGGLALAMPPGLFFTSLDQDPGVRLADVNGDGYVDLIHAFGPMQNGGDVGLPGRPHARTGACSMPFRPRPATTPQGEVFLGLRDGTGWSATPASGFALPDGVFFVRSAPAEAHQWTCDGLPMPSDAMIDADAGTLLEDVNGDGLPDLVVAASYGYDCTADGLSCAHTWEPDSNGVYLNVGVGWRYDAGWSTSLSTVRNGDRAHFHSRDLDCVGGQCPPDHHLADVDGDGLPELLERRDSTWFYYQNTGHGWDTGGAPEYQGFTLGRGEVYTDLNGDGRSDLLRLYRFESASLASPLATVPNMSSFVFMASPTTNATWLRAVNYPLGGKVRVSWVPSSNFRTTANTFLPLIMPVVSRVETFAGAGTLSRLTTYAYEGGRYDAVERDVRGFAKVIATEFGAAPAGAKESVGDDDTSVGDDGTAIGASLDPGGKDAPPPDEDAPPDEGLSADDEPSPDALTVDGRPVARIRVTTYHQEDELKGLVDEVVVKAAGGAVLRRSTNEFTALTVTGAPGVWDRRLTHQREYEGASTLLHHVQYVEYDAHANLLRRREETVGACPSAATTPAATLRCVAGSERETRWTYFPNETRWLLRYPAVEEVLVGGVAVATTRTTYDDAPSWSTAPQHGLATLIEAREAWEGHETWRHTTLAYDDHGNQRTVTDPLGNTTTLHYDASGRWLLDTTDALGHVTSFRYYGDGVSGSPVGASGVAAFPGALEAVDDPNGAQTLYEYDALGRKLAVWSSEYSDPVQTFAYPELGTPGHQRLIERMLSYDAGDGYFTTTTFLDGLGRTLQVRSEGDDGQELVTTTRWDALGRVAQTSLPEQVPVADAYDASIGVDWSSTEYDLLDRVTTQIRPDGSFTQYAYTGFVTTVSDDVGYLRDLQTDAYGRLWRVVERPRGDVVPAPDAPDEVTTYEYGPLDGLTRTVRPGGVTATYAYDSLGQRREADDPDRGDWRYTYDAAGHLIAKEDPEGRTLRLSYDALGRPLEKVADGQLLARYYYDNAQPPHGDQGLCPDVAWFDWGGTQGALPSWVTGYYAIQGTTDAADSSVVFPATLPPQQGELRHQLDPTRVSGRVRFSVTFRDAPGASLYLQLRGAGWSLLASGTDALGGELARGTGSVVTREVEIDLAAFPAANIVVRRGAGEVEIFQTALSRVAGAGAASAPVYVNADESVGRAFAVAHGVGQKTAVLDATGQTLYSYDPLGRLAAERKSLDGQGYVTDYTYTADDLPETITLPQGEVVSYGYDAARRMISLQSSRPTATSGPGVYRLIHDVSYSPRDGTLDGLSLGHEPGRPSLYTTHYERSDLLRRMTHLTTALPSGTLLQDYTYAYDPRGNLEEIRDFSSVVTTGRAGVSDGRGRAWGHFSYDPGGRLTQALVARLPGEPGPTGDDTIPFTWDRLGNLTSWEGRAQGYGAVCDADGPPDAAGGRGPHQLCSTCTDPNTCQSFAYDERGNFEGSTNWTRAGGGAWLPSTGRTFSYDVEGRLLRVSDPSSALLVDAVYDGEGTRVRRTLQRSASDVRTTLYVSADYEKRPTDAGGTTVRYFAFGRAIAERVHADGGGGPETVRFALSDHLGSSSVTVSSDSHVDGNGDGTPDGVLWVQTYGPFGDDRWGTETRDDAYKFTGQEQDTNWLYHFKARGYLPYLGVFLQPDPIATTRGRLMNPRALNPYAYALGNPLSVTDPSGMDPTPGPAPTATPPPPPAKETPTQSPEPSPTPAPPDAVPNAPTSSDNSWAINLAEIMRASAVTSVVVEAATSFLQTAYAGMSGFKARLIASGIYGGVRAIVRGVAGDLSGMVTDLVGIGIGAPLKTAARAFGAAAAETLIYQQLGAVLWENPGVVGLTAAMVAAPGMAFVEAGNDAANFWEGRAAHVPRPVDHGHRVMGWKGRGGTPYELWQVDGPAGHLPTNSMAERANYQCDGWECGYFASIVPTE